MEWIALATLILAFASAICGLYQWRYGNKTRRAEFITQIIEKLRFDKEIVEVMTLVDYGEETWYDDEFHNGGELEEKIDKLFSYLNHICYLNQNGLLSDKEIGAFKYELTRVCRSSHAQAYLWNLYHFSKTQDTICSFDNLIMYMRKNTFSENENIRFDNPKSKDKRLNF